MQTVARHNFTTVKTEGAILPADLLQRIAGGKLEGLQPAYYHLAPGERLNEAITRAWNRCQGVWETFNDQRQQLPESDSGVSLTRERWLLILFQELGYGRLAFQPRGLELPEDQSSIVNRQSSIRYPISHLWQQTPIHLVSFRQELDRRDPTIKRSPHSLIQEFLNRSDEHLWGFVSNGLTLQILRDNISLTRAAYVEFDLEKMMTEQVYADFTLLWLICHQSRVEIRPADDQAPISSPQSPANCWLEKWSQQAAEQGTRALDALRNGVQEAIAALGRGFLAHPDRENERLRQKLRSGMLSRDDYFRQLLRLVYRLIFLFVAEDRDLLLLPEADERARHRYATYYSAGRLRRLAEARRGGPHPDLYRALRRVFFLLRAGYSDLGLPALGSFLFSERSTPALDECDIANTDLLNAIRALAFTIEGQVTRPVDYKNLGAEELGSVYESLLELHPFLNIEAATFTLEVAAGSERKTTGSYYTPSSLINSLLDSALEPVVADRLQVTGGKLQGGAALEEALLSIKVVDPACGSGHFLIAAANRLAAQLARIRTGDDEPSPTARREALRKVVHNCIYGVDINEMAVELCKVGLWMETIDPGKPLGFLDDKIQCGNSLIGATPALLRQGIPDEAFTPITGDDKEYCKEWKALNKKEREGQLSMRFGTEPWREWGDLAAKKAEQNRMGDKTLADIRAKEVAHTQFIYSPEYERERLQADTWCAAFVWKKTNRFEYPITEQAFRRIVDNQHNVEPWMSEEIERLRNEYQFFHWHLVFSDVFQDGGFDVVLGNPPWERVTLEPNEWFASRSADVADASNASERKKRIRNLKQTDSALYAEFVEAKWTAEKKSLFIRSSNRFPLTGGGNINTYQVFAELSRGILNRRGHAGIVVFTGIATDYTTRHFFQDIIQNKALVSLYSFWEIRKFFAGTDTSLPFCLLTLSGDDWPIDEAEYAFDLKGVDEINQREKTFTLSTEDIVLINPNSLTCPVFNTRSDAEVTKKIYRCIPVLIKHGPSETNRWGFRFLRMLDMSNDSGIFRTQDQLESEGWVLSKRVFHRNEERYLPLYEGKMADAYNHRFASAVPKFGKAFRKSGSDEHSIEEWQDDNFHNLPLYWIPESAVATATDNYQISTWLIYKRVTRAAIERTFKSCIVPFPNCGLGDKVPALVGIDGNQSLLLQANFNSFVFDYASRQKVGNVNLAQFVLEQLPALPPEKYDEPTLWENDLQLHTWIKQRAIELTYTSYDLEPFAQAVGYHGPPFYWDEYRRFLLRSELDAAYFYLYNLDQGDVEFILSTFPLVERKERKEFGEYRTKRVILEIYNEIVEAITTGKPYQTRLNPPPADPRAAHLWDESYLGPYRDPSTWWPEVETVSVEKAVEEKKEGIYQPQAKAAHSVKEPAHTFQLKSSPASPTLKEDDKATPPAPIRASQQPLLDVMPAPSGPRSRRLKQAMALGKESSPTATRELVAFLADEDSNIRWLAGSSLVQRANSDVVVAIAAFLDGAEAERIAIARPEIQRVLGLIAEVVTDENLRDMIKQVEMKHRTG